MKQIKIIFIVILCLLQLPVYGADLSHLLPSERNTIEVFQKISPLVVNVHNLKTVITKQLNAKNVQAGVGSGFIWNKQGYIVTNYHVIRGANRIAVSLQKGKPSLARVIGADPNLDIAVLKLKNKALLTQLNHFQHFPLADSDNLFVGQKTIAIGNPFGLGHTLTTGVISALDRSIPSVNGKFFNDLIQTDASINPGNSGGPLLDSQGKLIGVNTIIISTTGSYAGIGFAVPVGTVKKVVAQIILHGKVELAGIGVQVFSDVVAKQLGVKGVIISKVIPKTPAAKAGLQGSWRDQKGAIHLGDVIVDINGKRINSYHDLSAAFSKVKIGQYVHVKYLSDGRIMSARIKTINVSAL